MASRPLTRKKKRVWTKAMRCSCEKHEKIGNFSRSNQQPRLLGWRWKIEGTFPALLSARRAFLRFFLCYGTGGGGKWQRISDKRAKAHCWCLAWILQICRGGCGWVGWGKKRIKLRNCMAALNSCKSGRLHWLLKCKRVFLLQLSYWECNLQTAYSITLALLRYLLKNWKEELSWLPCVYFRNQQDQFIRKYNFLHSFLIQCSSLSPVDSR